MYRCHIQRLNLKCNCNYIALFQVCFADINTDEGEQTEKAFNNTYGPHAALFVKCDVTNETEFRGTTLY